MFSSIFSIFSSLNNPKLDKCCSLYLLYNYTIGGHIMASKKLQKKKNKKNEQLSIFDEYENIDEEKIDLNGP